jgi:hypothetical protein
MAKIAELEFNTQWIDEECRRTHRLDERDTKSVNDSANYPWKGENIVIHDQNFYPAHYFDYIAGTSTGG